MSGASMQAPARRSLRPFIILALILLTIAAGGFGYYLVTRDYATTDDAQIDGSIYTVAPQISGRVASVLVNDNQHVLAGQVLAIIDDRDQVVAVARASASLAQAKAQLAVARANAGEAQANADVANAALLEAQQDFNRYQSVNPHAISQLQLDSATATIRGARAKYAAATQQAAAMQASALAANAAVGAAEVSLEDAELQLSYTKILSPAAGHISEKTVEPGNVVAAGTGLMALVGDDVWVTANYKETQIAGIHAGSPATVMVDAVPGVTFKAHVDSIQYGTGAVFSLLPAQNATGNYVKIVQRIPVKIVFDDSRAAQYPLSPGMSVRPSISIKQ